MFMPVVDFPVRLDAKTKEHHDRHGFATIERISVEEETAWFRTVYDRLLADRLDVASKRPGGLRGPLTNTLWISLSEWEMIVFARTALVRNAKAMAAGLLDVSPDELSIGVRFFFKPAGGGRPVPWHQDEAHKNPDFDHRSVNVWVPLEAAHEDNGCLQYIPGSHLGGIRVHRHPGWGAPEFALLTDDVRPCEAVPAVLPAGGACFHHSRTVHSSGSNNTSEHRRAMALVCAAPPIRRPTRDDRPWLHDATGDEVPSTSF